MTKKNRLRSIVLTWTIVTTTFFWTSSMRMIFKPEISSWRIFNLGGEGSVGDFWFPPLVVIFALFLFYLEGRGRLRSIYHSLLIGWHLLITGVMFYGGLQTDTQISFGTWGIKLDLVWLVLPITVFLILSIVLVFKEVRDPTSIPIFSWGKIDKKILAAALALFVISFIFFSLGTGFDRFVKVAVFATIIQWILIVESLGRPKLKEKAMSGNQVT